MLVSKSTSTKGLVHAVLGNAEIASLGKAPVNNAVERVAQVAEARKWYIDMDDAEFGEARGDGSFAGFGAGYCIDWVYNCRASYMMELVDEWKKSDQKILRMMSDMEKKHAAFYKKFGYNSKRVVASPHPNTPAICSATRAIMRECKEKYYG
jgi:hypothetical protein